MKNGRKAHAILDLTGYQDYQSYIKHLRSRSARITLLKQVDKSFKKNKIELKEGVSAMHRFVLSYPHLKVLYDHQLRVTQASTISIKGLLALASSLTRFMVSFFMVKQTLIIFNKPKQSLFILDI